ncbi:uracil phosphoribosyltransferase [Marinomonas atlantica]|uniref:uracil phosphoribosyltransferase n=1 Tax=Marinomonas atlantica TaxID=1806668 RepID=UPI00082A7A72|nr:uracil phosphoribosyltransferase [Marinomonas atlantica]
MKEKIESEFALYKKLEIRSKASNHETIRSAVTILGEELGKKIVELYFLRDSGVSTPMNAQASGRSAEIPLCAVITTSDDFQYLGKGLARHLDEPLKGSMSFNGQRGLEALKADISSMNLPNTKEHVDTLIIAKAVLATGCTAVHLAKSAISKYSPRRVIIASVYYSNRGLTELSQAIPNADILLIGDADQIDEDGMLVPGVGNLDLRITG